MDTTVHTLRARFPRPGQVTWIGLRPAHRAPVQVVSQATLIAGHGIEGDRSARRAGSKRQVSLLQAEHLPVIAQLTGRSELDPAWLRRNIVIAGINLHALRQRRFRLGDAVLEWSGECHPCSRMEQALGEGGYNAVRGHGGILARVLRGGTVALGDALWAEPAATPGAITRSD